MEDRDRVDGIAKSILILGALALVVGLVIVLLVFTIVDDIWGDGRVSLIFGSLLLIVGVITFVIEFRRYRAAGNGREKYTPPPANPES